MKYLKEFHNAELAKNLFKAINYEVQPQRTYRLMEFCGGHTHAIFRYGLNQALPKNIELIHGPGCPVCVLPIARLDQAIAYARQPNTLFCSFGDMMRVPASRKQTLLRTKSQGANIHIIYSAGDALKLAQSHPDKQVIFFAIGFETTTPPTALVIKQAAQLQLTNFTVFNNHVLTPAAIQAILDTPNKLNVDGLIGPGHVSTIIGSDAYTYLAEKYQRPIVVSGFEPLDILHGILMLVRQLNEKRSVVENQYLRAVNAKGNQKAIAVMEEVFELRKTFEWRGLGFLENSALNIKPDFSAFDAEQKILYTPEKPVSENKACACGDVLRGIKKPTECEIFATICTPENPLGACMVSSEGACAAQYKYDRYEQDEKLI